MTETEAKRLGVRLGYAYLDRDPSTVLPLREFVLPMRPFLKVGRLVIVRELVLDADGYSRRGILGARKMRYLVRWLGGDR